MGLFDWCTLVVSGAHLDTGSLHHEEREPGGPFIMGAAAETAETNRTAKGIFFQQVTTNWYWTHGWHRIGSFSKILPHRHQNQRFQTDIFIVGGQSRGLLGNPHAPGINGLISCSLDGTYDTNGS